MSTANAGRIEVSLVLDGGEAFVVDVKKAGQSLDSFSKKANKAGKETETWGHKLRDTAIILGLARNALANLNDLILGMPRAIIQQNALLERQQFLIAGMNTEATSYAEAQKQANEQMKELINISSRSPYALQAVSDSYAKLSAGGIKDTTESLEALIGASAKMGATSEAFKRASIAIQQMAGKGVISMEELRQQLGEAIPNVMPMMADAVGMEMGRMVKLISTGAMEAHSALDNLFREMFWTSMGAAELMSQTWEGTMNRISNSLTVFAKNIGDFGFFEVAKEAANELNDALSSPEMVQVAQQISNGLTTATQVAVSLAKAMNSIFKELTAIAGFFALNSVITKGLEAWGGLKKKVDDINTAFVEDNKAQQKKITDEIADQVSQREAVVKDSTDRTRRYVEAGQLRSYQQVRDFQKAQTKEIMSATSERLAVLDSSLQEIEQKSRSTTERMRSVGRSMWVAIGGWSTVITAGIVGIIYLMDELIFKQNRAAENMMRNNGLYTTVTEFEMTSAQLVKKQEALTAAETELKRLLDGEKGSNGATTLDDQSRIQILTERVATLKKEVDRYMANLSNAEKYLSNVAEQQGEAMFKMLNASELANIQANLEKAQKQIRDTILGQAGDRTDEEIEKALKRGLIGARQEAFDKINELAKAFVKDQQKILKSLDGDNSLDANTHRDQINSAIKSTQAFVKQAEENIDIVDQKFLTMGQNGLSVAESTIASYKRQIAMLESRNKHLQQGVELEDKIAALEADIASGKYKNAKPKDVAEMKRLVKILQEVFNLNKKLTKEVRDRNKAVNRLNQLAIKAKSNLGTAKAKSDNPFLKWEEGLSRTLEQLREIKIQIGDTSKLTEEQRKAIAVDEARLRAAALQTAILDAHNQQRERQIELTESLSDEYERYLSQSQREADYLKETERALEQKLTEVEKNSDEYKLILRTLELIRQNIKMTAEESKKINPKVDGWYKLRDTIDNMQYQFDNELADSVDGLFDGFAQNIVDTEFSFSAMIESMIQDLSKFAIKMTAMKVVTAAFDAFFGPSTTTDAMARNTPKETTGSSVLKTYSKGGIATSPQIALFGEGSMNEAYVPLPDGRSIPVTMKGSAGAAPVVNVINQTGVQADAEAQNVQFDGERYIVDVVMKAAARPGKFRNALKGI